MEPASPALQADTLPLSYQGFQKTLVKLASKNRLEDIIGENIKEGTFLELKQDLKQQPSNRLSLEKDWKQTYIRLLPGKVRKRKYRRETVHKNGNQTHLMLLFPHGIPGVSARQILDEVYLRMSRLSKEHCPPCGLALFHSLKVRLNRKAENLPSLSNCVWIGTLVFCL